VTSSDLVEQKYVIITPMSVKISRREDRWCSVSAGDLPGDPVPPCGCEIQIIHHRLEIPHFPDLLLVSIACDACGYRHTDTIIPEEGRASPMDSTGSRSPVIFPLEWCGV